VLDQFADVFVAAVLVPVLMAVFVMVVFHLAPVVVIVLRVGMRVMFVPVFVFVVMMLVLARMLMAFVVMMVAVLLFLFIVVMMMLVRVSVFVAVLMVMLVITFMTMLMFMMSVLVVMVSLAMLVVLVLVVRVGGAFVDAKLHSLDFLPLFAVKVHVEIAEIELRKLPFESGRFDAEVNEGAHSHIAGDAGKTVEEEDFHGNGTEMGNERILLAG
jgi:hypothetical protein